MKKVEKTIAELQSEIDRLRHRVAELENAESTYARERMIFRRMLSRARDGIMIIDETGKIIAYNPALEKMTGRSAAETIGMDAVDVQFAGLPEERQTPETYRRFREAMDEILTTGHHPLLTGTHEYRYFDENGNARTAQKSAFTIKTEKGYMLASFDRDITERKTLESRWRESEQRYELATEGARVGVWDWDLTTNAMYIDPRLKAMLGYADDEIRNHMDDWSRLIHPDDLPVVEAATRAYVSGETDHYQAPHRMVRKDGSVCWMLARGTKVTDIDGRAVRLVGTSTDITELVDARLEAETLRDVTLALVSHTTVDDVLSEILAQAKKLVSFSTANVALVEHDFVRVLQSIGYEKYGSEDFIRNLSFNLDGNPITYTPIHTKTPIIVGDAHADPRWVVFEPTAWIQSYIGIPLVLHDRVLGVLQIDSDTPHAFSPADAERLKPLATAAAIAIENARLLSTAQKRAEQLAMVHHVGEQVSRLLNEDELLETTARLIRRTMAYDTVQIGRVKPETQTVCLACRAGSLPLDEKIEQSIEQGIIGRAARTGRTQLVLNTAADPDFLPCMDGMQSELAIPIKMGDTVFGVLDVESKQLAAFDDADVIALEAMAGQLGVILENARLYRQAKADAETKAVLLREVNHRVKNNLAVIIGLLYLEQRRQTDPHTVTMLEDLTNRVRGMATAHELLSASVWQPISLETLVKETIQNVTQSMHPSMFVRVQVSPSPVKVVAEQAANFALMINELATNAIKYAVSESPVLTIDVSITAEDGMITLVFKDNGPGYGTAAHAENRLGTGLDLVTTIVRKLGGTVSLSDNSGAMAVLHVPQRT